MPSLAPVMRTVLDIVGLWMLEVERADTTAGWRSHRVGGSAVKVAYVRCARKVLGMHPKVR
jgi:hypothetical protein